MRKARDITTINMTTKITIRLVIMLAVLDNWGQQHEYRYNNNNNNNKPSSSTAQQRGKPPHCALQKRSKINETHRSVQLHQRDKNIEMRSSTNIHKKNTLGLTQFLKVGLYKLSHPH